MGLLQLVQPMEEEEEDRGGGDKDDFLALKDGETAWRLIQATPPELLRYHFE